MVQTVAGEKGDGDGSAGRWGGVVEDCYRRRGGAPGSGGFQGRDMGKVREGLEACSADDCYRDGV